MPGSWKAVLAAAILLVGCSSKQNTAPPAEAFSVTSDGTVHEIAYSGYTLAKVMVGVKFTSTSSKSCLLDSVEINSPNDSVSGGRAILRKSWHDTLASGDTTSREFTIADSRDPLFREPGAAPYPPGRGHYSVRGWGRWDGTTHESPPYTWIW